jgi:archaeosortase B (VPXXXP-CTERM-specific)
MKEKLVHKKGRSYLITCFLFAGLILIFDLVIFSLHEVRWLDPFIDLTAVLSAYLMNLFGMNAVLSGQQILLKSRTLNITLECTSIFIAALYSALVAAYPAAGVRKLKALAVGIPVIISVNLLRLLTIAVVSERLPFYFDYMHDYIWQVAFILLTGALWLALLARGETNQV